MTTIKPWVSAPLELIRHAEGHLKSGSDFDRRMALIGFDNSIEMSIITYLSLHPDQRNGTTFMREDVQRWESTFHTKLEFLEHYLALCGRPMRIPRDEIIYYHRLRNELYHRGAGFVPKEDDIARTRETALWIFSELFGVDPEALLSQEPRQPIVSMEGQSLSEETSFLEEFITMRQDLNMLLSVIGATDPDDATQVDVDQAWSLLAAQSGNLPTNFEETLKRAADLRDGLVQDGSPLPDEEQLHLVSSEMKQVSNLVDRRLREHQKQIVEKAIAATMQAASPNGNRRAGIVWQAQGSGLPMSVCHYLAQVTEISELRVVVLVDRLETGRQVVNSFTSCNPGLMSEVIETMSAEHLHEVLGDPQRRIIFTTIQKFRALPPVSNASQAWLVVAYDVLSLGTYVRSLVDALPNATFILFTNRPIQAGSQHSQLFGELIYVYDRKRAIQEGYAVPVRIENRTFILYERSIAEDFSTPEITEVLEGMDEETWSHWRTAFESAGQVHLLAEDIVNHFESRLSAIDGKGMILVPDRMAAVRLYEQMIRLRPDWHSDKDGEGFLKIVITGTISDSPDLRRHGRSVAELQVLGERFEDPNSPLKLVISSGLWLTGKDVPSLHTLYICKPMSSPALQQAMARVGRAFQGKQEGLVVDYSGSANEFQDGSKL